MKNKTDKLVCIYTCKKDKKSLSKFKTTNLYKSLLESNDISVVEIYAGSDYTKLENNKLYLSCEEDYSMLSIKTYEMIKECVNRFDFDYLYKIDCNIFEYEHKKFGLTNTIKKDLFNEELVTNIILFNKLNLDYFGSVLTFLRSFDSLNKWAINENVKLKCKKSDINFSKPYYIGKFYICDKKFCEYISQNGENKANYFAKDLGGMEDLFIGDLYAEYKHEHLEMVVAYLTNILEHKKYSKTTMIYLYNIYTEFKSKYKKYNFDKENCLTSDFFDFKKFKENADLNDKKMNYIENKLGIV